MPTNPHRAVIRLCREAALGVVAARSAAACAVEPPVHPTRCVANEAPIDAVVARVVSRCTEAGSGKRVIGEIPTNTLLPRISFEDPSRLAEGRAPQSLRPEVADGDFSHGFD